MKEWLKFISLSFYSDKIAMQAPRRGFGNVFLSAVLSFVFLLLGLIASFTVPFDANYKNTPDLVATVERALSVDGASLEIKNGTLYSDKIIDTVANEGDRQNYSRGYDIIIDARSAGTFDDFTAYCVSQSGKEITYEHYLELGEDEKTLYEFKILYSGRTLDVDEALKEKCEAYLDGAADEETLKSYDEIKNKTGEEYANALYDLYVRTYYPALTAYESDGGAPKTRNYYYHNYRDREKILYVFNDSMMGAYVTKTGAKNTFYGYYGNMFEREIGHSAEEANGFIKESFKGAVSMTVFGSVMSFFSVAPFTVLVAFAVIIALFCFTKLLKLDELKFGAAAKIVCAFVATAALITALVTFALGFLVSQNILAWLEGIVFFAVLMIRTAIMLIIAAVKRKREQKESTNNAVTEGSDDPVRG